MSEASPSISFIVPVRNDAARLDRCLRSIRQNHYPPERLSIVVADNGSIDDSANVARSHGARVLSLPGVRLGALRNAAAEAATGELLAFADADHEIDPGWVAAAAELLADPQVGGAGAPPHPPAPGTWVQRAYDCLRDHSPGRRLVDWLGSGNLAMKRDVFLAAGGFDTSLETCEDVDLCRKLRLRDVTLVADSRLRSIHYGDPETVRQVFLGELWRGRDNIRVSLRPPHTWRMLISAMLPAAAFIAMVGVAAALLAPLRAWPLAAGSAAFILSLVGLRTLVMLGRRPTGLSVLQLFVVASAYECGRALAVVGRFGYGHRRETPGPTASGSGTGA